MQTAKINSIDDYIAGFPEEIQERLMQMRTTIQKAAPEATEDIKYAMPTFVMHGNLVHFAAFKNHIGFYATPSGHDYFHKDLAKYNSGKGSVQFPHTEPLPLALVADIVKFRVKENTEKREPKRRNNKALP